jgi:hypothetical protein
LAAAAVGCGAVRLAGSSAAGSKARPTPIPIFAKRSIIADPLAIVGAKR